MNKMARDERTEAFLLCPRRCAELPWLVPSSFPEAGGHGNYSFGHYLELSVVGDELQMARPCAQQ